MFKKKRYLLKKKSMYLGFNTFLWSLFLNVLLCLGRENETGLNKVNVLLVRS